MAQNYVLLERIELNATAASVTFSNIPQTGYTDLKVVVSARGTTSDGGAGTAQLSMLVSINGSTTGVHKFIYGNGSTAGGTGSGSLLWNYMNANTSTANTFSNSEFYFPNYSSTTQYKSYSIDSVIENNATGTLTSLDAGLVSSNSAITSIGFVPNTGSFVQYSTFSLYGIAAVGTTPAIAPKADGGNVIATDGTYWYHAFLSNGTFTPQSNLTADILQVAGGASGTGGDYACAGGGAGGLLTFTGQSLSTGTNYAAVIGAGGAARAVNTGNGNNGSNSQFSALTASVGGGGGGGYIGSGPGDGQNGNAGGSGGGGSYPNHTGGAGTSGQGNAGGNANGAGPGYPGGSGGGAGGAGLTPANSSTPANGGVGLSSSLTNAMGAATSTGQLSGGNYYYAGGGAGGGYISTTGGTGGLGGGGNGQGAGNGAAGFPGTANTGGGGGGSGQGGLPGAGGSGIIIIRYPVAS